MPTIDERLEIAYNVMPKDLLTWFEPIRAKILGHLHSGEVEAAKDVVLKMRVTAEHVNDQKQFADIIESIANG